MADRFLSNGAVSKDAVKWSETGAPPHGCVSTREEGQASLPRRSATLAQRQPRNGFFRAYDRVHPD